MARSRVAMSRPGLRRTGQIEGGGVESGGKCGDDETVHGLVTIHTVRVVYPTTMVNTPPSAVLLFPTRRPFKRGLIESRRRVER